MKGYYTPMPLLKNWKLSFRMEAVYELEAKKYVQKLYVR